MNCSVRSRHCGALKLHSLLKYTQHVTLDAHSSECRPIQYQLRSCILAHKMGQPRSAPKFTRRLYTNASVVIHKNIIHVLAYWPDNHDTETTDGSRQVSPCHCQTSMFLVDRAF